MPIVQIELSKPRFFASSPFDGNVYLEAFWWP